jgi:hypothetical protein
MSEQTLLEYEDIREQIEDGDVFLFQGTVFFSRLIERVSHGAYSHCAIAANWGERKMILQAELLGGVQAVPLSVAVGTYKGKVHWYQIRPESRQTLDIKALLREAKADLGLDYNTSDLLLVAAHNFFRSDLPKDCEHPDALFCSQYVHRCFVKAGLPLTDGTAVGTSPSDIAQSNVLVFRGEIRHDPEVIPDRTLDVIPPAERSL